MLSVKKYKFWFCTGSQDLYGDECLEHVVRHGTAAKWRGPFYDSSIL